VFPRVAEVAFVAELHTLVWHDLLQRGFRFITIRLPAEAHVLVVTRIGIARFGGEKMVQMTVGSTHRDLENSVDPAQIGIAGHPKPPPDVGLRADQEDFQLIDRSLGFPGGWLDL
jgi:hypothetical protein